MTYVEKKRLFHFVLCFFACVCVLFFVGKPSSHDALGDRQTAHTDTNVRQQLASAYRDVEQGVIDTVGRIGCYAEAAASSNERIQQDSQDEQVLVKDLYRSWWRRNSRYMWYLHGPEPTVKRMENAMVYYNLSDTPGAQIVALEANDVLVTDDMTIVRRTKSLSKDFKYLLCDSYTVPSQPLSSTDVMPEEVEVRHISDIDDIDRYAINVLHTLPGEPYLIKMHLPVGLWEMEPSRDDSAPLLATYPVVNKTLVEILANRFHFSVDGTEKVYRFASFDGYFVDFGDFVVVSGERMNRDELPYRDWRSWFFTAGRPKGYVAGIPIFAARKKEACLFAAGIAWCQGDTIDFSQPTDSPIARVNGINFSVPFKEV